MVVSPEAETGIKGAPVTRTCPVSEQPNSFTVVMVYCVVAAGLANGLAMVDELSPAEGDQL